MPDFGSNVATLQQYSALIELGLSDIFKSETPTHDAMYKTWLRVKSANEWIEDELVFTGLGPMPAKGLGAPFTTDKPLISSPKDFELGTWAMGVVMEYELVRWDKYGCFKNITKLLKRSGVDRKNIQAYAILNNSFSTANPKYTTYRNEALCSPAHTLLRGGTGKNAPTTAVDLTYLGIQEGVTDFATLVNEDGLFVMREAKCLKCHPAKRWIADTLIKSTYRPDNANMAYNTVGGRFDVYDSPYLTATGPWWLLAAKDSLRVSFNEGDAFQFRRAFDHATWNNVFSVYTSFTVAVLHWEGIWGSQGT